MNNLRDEIRQIIEYAQRDAVIYVEDLAKGNKDAILPNPLDISNVILSMIEKRIDEFISEHTKKTMNIPLAESIIPKYSEDGFHNELVKELRKFKEMLK